MKKILLLGMLAFLGLQTFSFAPGNSKATDLSYVVPGIFNGMSVEQLMKLTPKKYQQLTGRKMTFKEKIGLAVLKTKLQSKLPADKAAARKTDLGLLSLIFGGAAWLFALIPGIGAIGIVFAAAAIIFGILGLNRKKGDTKSIIGLVLGSLFVLLVIVAIASIAAWGWY